MHFLPSIISFLFTIFSFSLTAADLHEAVRNGNQQLVFALITEMPESVHYVDAAGNTPLHIAAQNGDLILAGLLLQNGAKAEVTNSFGHTPNDLISERDREKFEILVLEHESIKLLESKLSPSKKRRPEPVISSPSKRRKVREIEKHLKRDRQEDSCNSAGFPLGKLSRKDPDANPHGFSILSSKQASFACLPGKEAILGKGTNKVKAGALLFIDKRSPGSDLFKPGDDVALKFRAEPFEKEEIEVLRRQGILMAPPIKYKTNKGARWACGMKLIHAKTLWDWMLAADPHQLWGMSEFLDVANMVNQKLASLHSKFISHQDSNLDNFLVEDLTNEIVIIDFGNAFIFEPEEKESLKFADCCQSDSVTAFATIFGFLHENDYPESLQNTFWIEAFDYAREYFNEFHGKSNMAHGSSAYDIVSRYSLAEPSFLTAIYGEDGADKNTPNIDEIISKDIDNHLLKLILEDK